MTDVTNEEWRPILGFEGYYSVSNLGRVRTEARQATMKNGRVWQVPERILKCGATGKGGYPRFNAGVDGKSTVLFVHQCVMLAFVGPPPAGQEVRHRNGRASDPALANLIYGTRKENIADAKAHGTFPMHEMRPGAKITRDDAALVAESGDTAETISEQLGIKRATVQQIRRGETWGAFTSGRRRVDYMRRGESASWSKLTEDQVREIFCSPRSQRDLAGHFGVSRRAISFIKNGRNWKHITGAKAISPDPAS